MFENNTSRPIVGTYRVQMFPGFSFEKCAEIVPYLRELGISHLYCSPYLEAEENSSSGYDVTEHTQISKELGGDEGLQTLHDALQPEMGQVLDIVPNHMSIKTDKNKLWMEVLEKGQQSEYAKFFDLDWNPPAQKLHNKVLIPVLGGHYFEELENRNIKITRVNDRYFVNYFDKNYPVNEKGTKIIKERLKEDRDYEIDGINREPEFLDSILKEQYYLLSNWKAADSEINYRRFFAINHLVGLTVEDQEVFENTHHLILKMLKNGQLDGLRVDHIDGLREPGNYLERLRKIAGDKWIIVEKILGVKEEIPGQWPVQGTTGYDFLNIVNGLFIDRKNKKEFSKLYRSLTEENRQYKNLLFKKKILTIEKSFAGESKRLERMLEKIAMEHIKYRDLTSVEIAKGLVILIACFPVYRTYLNSFDNEIDERDKAFIDEAIDIAKKKKNDIHPLVWDFFEDLLLMRLKGKQELEFLLRFQQLTGPVMAKGAEDTAFYCFNYLVSLNEVGGEPSRFGTSLEEFHNYCKKVQKKWPYTLQTTSTHDTKRGEDVRMRINMLSEIPGKWLTTVSAWFENNTRHHDARIDKNTEYLLYQTLVGAWPIEEQRLSDYMIKAVREEKVHTSWTKVRSKYEEAILDFTDKLYKDNDFISSLESFIEPLLEPAWISSLAQTLIKYTVPGIPDLYQGSELWDMSLVDPDNRRPVDYESRKKMLYDIHEMSLEQILEKLSTGIGKMYVIQKVLKVRHAYIECFGADSTYVPVIATGLNARHIVAYHRQGKIAAIVPRFLITLGNDWGDTNIQLPLGKWRNIFTDDVFSNDLKPAILFKKFPVSLLVNEK